MTMKKPHLKLSGHSFFIILLFAFLQQGVLTNWMPFKHMISDHFKCLPLATSFENLFHKHSDQQHFMFMLFGNFDVFVDSILMKKLKLK